MNRYIIAVVDDMFFAAKVRATAEALGVSIKFSRTMERLLLIAKEELPALILVDLHNQNLNAFDVASAIKSIDELKNVQLLGFFSHVQTDLQRKALEAGYDKVIPRSVFSRDLAQILKAAD
jgi:CheY-like chemotaxis protein